MAKSGEIAVIEASGGPLPQSDARRSGLLYKLAVVTPLALLIIYAMGWVAAVQQYQGVEGLVRWTDFKSTLTGATIIRDGDGPRLYDLQTQLDAQNRVLAPYIPPISLSALLPYNHLPFEALLITPLMGLPYSLIFALWTLLMLLALGLSLRIMSRALPVPREALLVMVLAAVSYQPVFRSFILGQNSPLVLLGLCGAYAASQSRRDAWAGAALLLVTLKPQILPVVLLLFVLQGRWKALATFGGLLIALCVAVMPLLGIDWPVQYARLLLGVANWQETGAIDPAIMHNWRGFFTNLFGSWAPGLVSPLFGLFSLASIGLLVWTWRLRNAECGMRNAESTSNSPHSAFRIPHCYDLLWALTGVVAVLTSLHLNPHDLMLLIFPAWIIGAYIAGGRWGKRLSSVWLYILWAGYALIPLTFYTTDPGLAVVPNVLLMSLAAVLLARQTKGVLSYES